MTLGRRTLANGLWNLAGTFWPALLALATTPVLLRGLGPDGFGAWAAWGAVGGMLLLLDFGMAPALTRHLAAARAQDDVARGAALVRGAAKFYAVAALAGVLLLLGLALAGAVPGGGDDPVPWRESALVAGALACTLAGMPATARLTAWERYDGINRVHLVARTGLAALSVWAVLAGRGLAGVLAAQLAAAAGTTAALMATARRVHPLPAGRIRRRVDWREVAGFSVRAQLAGMLGMAYLQGGRLLLSALSGPAAVAHFAVPDSLSQRFHALVGGGMNVVFPVSTALAETRDLGRLRRLFTGGTALALQAAMVFAVGVAALGGPFLAAWLGPEYVGPVLGPLRAVSAGYALVAVNVVAFYTAWGTGRVGLTLALHALLAATLGAAGLVLIPAYGAAGAAQWLVTSAWLAPRAQTLPGIFGCAAVSVAVFYAVLLALRSGWREDWGLTTVWRAAVKMSPA